MCWASYSFSGCLRAEALVRLSGLAPSAECRLRVVWADGSLVVMVFAIGVSLFLVT